MVGTAAQLGSTVIGREAELPTIVEFLDASRAGSAALVLEGDAGIGKTTIVRAALERAAAIGLEVLLARPSAGEKELPYAALADLLAPVDEHALAALPAPQREAVEVALGRADGIASKFALSRGLLELLRTLGAKADVLLVVDDVQWLDRPTASALAFALRRLDSSTPLRLLLTLRSGSGAHEVPLALRDWEVVHRLRVSPMSATSLGALLRQRLEIELPRPQLKALHRASGGNPMFALELAQREHEGRWEGITLSAAIADQLSTLDPNVQTALAHAAAALRPTPELLLAAGVARDELRQAVESGALELSGDRLSFSHPLLASVGYEQLLPDERREIHARLAAASADPVERGHHVSRATLGRNGSAAETVQAAAETAAARGDHAGAAALWLRAGELSLDPGGETATRRKLEAAGELLHAGDPGAAAGLCRVLIDRLPPGPARARARQLLALTASGPEMSYVAAREELSRALDDAGDDPALRAELHVELSELACGLCNLEDAVAHAQTAFALADQAGATATSVAALAIEGFAEGMLGRGVPDAARRAYARWDGTVGWGNSPRMVLACACMHATEFEEAADLFEQEIRMAGDLGLEPFEVIARGHLAEVQLRSGEWAEGRANALLASEHARQAADSQIVAAASCVLAMAEALLGNHDRARALAAEALAASEATKDFWWTIGGRAVLGLVATAEDRAQEAADVLEPAWALMLERGLDDLSLFPVAHVLGEAFVRCGRLDDALAIAAALEHCSAGNRPWCRAMAPRLRALVASARGHHHAARDAIAAALEAHAELPEPFEHARTLHLAGRVERKARSWGAARSAFVEALERFDQLGAARWAEKVAADLSRLPGRRRDPAEQLTAREREIAELAGRGETNKAIAARLFLSVRTVEANLSKAYVKLGVRSRTELATQLVRGEGEQRLSVDSHN